MHILNRLKEFLEQNHTPYETFTHGLAYTAQEVAALQHISGDELAKVVMLVADDNLMMAVIPGNRKLDLDLCLGSLAVANLRLATEDEFAARFPECEIGAMPPFGNLFDLPVVVDPAVEKDEYIYFNAGNHAQTVHLKYQDFKEMVKPRIARLTGEGSQKAA